MLKTNEKRVVELLLQCYPGFPHGGGRWRVGHSGKPYALPSIGGITLNVEIGDPAFGWAADHLEPGVSATANGAKPFEYPNPHLQALACVGDPVVILTGKAKGRKGCVIGHHGGSEHLILHFPRAAKERMTYDDKMLIRSLGQGLELLDYPDVRMLNMNPALLHKLKIREQKKDGSLLVPVTTLIPAECMGSGLGCDNMNHGDYDVMTSDPGVVKKHLLDKMRFGDFVAILDHDNSYGPALKKNAVSIGIVVHSDCKGSGHGPGIALLMSSAVRNRIRPVLDPKANIKYFLPKL